MTRIVLAQFGVTFLLAIVLIVVGLVPAYSALLGGLSLALPSGYMAWRSNRRVAEPAAALVILINAEIGKLLLTALFMGAVFVWVKPLEPGYFFLALGVVMACYVIVPMVVVATASQEREGQQ